MTRERTSDSRQVFFITGETLLCAGVPELWMQLRDAAGVWLFRGPGGILPNSEVEWQEPKPEPHWRCQLRWVSERWNLR